ncbi:MAG: ABC transporter ATP-binding protein [Cytophagales bacterium]|nr:ABC transporter ATP-binding protein [Cytophagales bacterium]
MELAVHNIGHQYNSQAVLSSITYAFAENKTTAILGKSGSGKTTLLQILNGMVKPNAGAVTISNLPLNYNASVLRTKMG